MSFRSHSAVLVTLACLAIPTSAQALTRFFTGTVVSVSDTGGHLGVAVSDPVSGHFHWRPGMNQLLDTASYAIYQQAASPSFTPIGLTLTVGGVTYSVVPGANVTLHVYDDHSTFDDRVSLGDAALSNTGGLTYAANGATVALQDTDGTALSSTAIPTALPALTAFESALVTLTLGNINGTSDSAVVTIELNAFVPAPVATPAGSPTTRTVAALLLAAVAAAGIARSRGAGRSG